ncbi:class I SAM-dependent methyltransferase [Alicyclobacillus tolerans]|uniref:Methyltransferase domain-containing protein n=1 Tax=Alicyclobacillus tolerans TaxID=90970 RepID=A0A1M6YF35_9BACL|nr:MULTISPECIES: methyltransferase domain-containing protein [Alicyclobacillus]QRF22885.1 methyltransferase domain-containing protein [Alicyclobacillus sp. TC]SHL16635.1 Methyltransferase domain-containing protein [Alicyclobacillus montanus]
MGHRFNPAHVDRLLSEERRTILPPEPILSQLDIQSMHTVADVGCGPGYFTLPAAQMTQSSVYGVDVSSEMLAYLTDRAKEENMPNIIPIQSSAEQIDLPNESIDRLLCSFVLHEVDNLQKVLSEFQRIIKTDGKMLFLEWEKKMTGFGPPVDERLDAETLEAHIKEMGWRSQRFQPNTNHYGLLIERV